MGRKKTKEDRQPSSIENWFDLACDDLKKWCNGGDNRRCFILLTSETITPKDSGGDENAESHLASYSKDDEFEFLIETLAQNMFRNKGLAVMVMAAYEQYKRMEGDILKWLTESAKN